MRIPIITDLATRDGTLTKDSKVLNGFIDDGLVFKRPAVNSVLATAAGQAQGGVYDTNSLGYFINGDILKSYNAAFTLVQTITL